MTRFLFIVCRCRRSRFPGRDPASRLLSSSGWKLAIVEIRSEAEQRKKTAAYFWLGENASPASSRLE
ncbi:MAG: hypothetical protein LBS49_07685 [Candidatus Accumulibacter sp.]|jgi:hypothetical protein|nr:hypothetical protein [Accumulibacter sp.]